jgi:hypothetical protein
MKGGKSNWGEFGGFEEEEKKGSNKSYKNMAPPPMSGFGSINNEDADSEKTASPRIENS